MVHSFCGQLTSSRGIVCEKVFDTDRSNVLQMGIVCDELMEMGGKGQ